MAIPNVVVTVTDGALGLQALASPGASAKIGVSAGGVVNTVYSFNDIVTATATLVSGPLLEAVAHQLAIAGGPVLCVPVTASNPGYTAFGRFFITGSGTGTIAVSALGVAVTDLFQVKIILGGAVATATFQFSMDGGVTFSTTITTAASVVLTGAGAGITLTFVGTYVTNDVYASTFAFAGSGTGIVGRTGTPSDTFSALIKVTLGGVLGASQFQYSLDGGDTYSQVLATTATYAIPNSGLTLTFSASGSFTGGDVYSATAIGPSFALGDLATASTNLISDVRPWNWLHIVGTATGVGATAVTNFSALEAGVNTTITGAITNGRFTFALLEMPDVTDAQAFVDTTTSTRLMTALGYTELVSQVTGRISKRSQAWSVSARMAKTTVARDPGAVIDGSLPGITASVDQPLGLWRDENASPGGDAAGFVTLRKYAGGPNGYYVTTGRMRAAAGSDYVYVSNRRVMDLACAIARPALTKYINSNVRVDPVTGFIDPRDANNIEADINGQLRSALISPQPQQASDVTVVVNRAANILSTGILPVSVRVTPLGYVRQLTLEIGFFNPALVAKAA